MQYRRVPHGTRGLKPDVNQLKNLIELSDNILDPLIEYFGRSNIKILSMFRSKTLNDKIKGAKNSQHMALNGAAVDIETYVNSNYRNADLFNYIKDNLNFDQLIWEHGDEKEPDWVHVSYKSSEGRKQILRAIIDTDTNQIKYINF